MKGEQMKSDHPKVSIITPSLNTKRFLRETIENILSQTLRDFELIVVDGGSTDGTVDILKEYPQIRWISEKETDENPIVEAYRKAFEMSRGEYIIQCCVSDGFVSRKWFQMCSDKLDEDKEVSLVWGLPQYMTEDGNLWRVTNHEFLKKAPPQKQAFLPFWLAYAYGFPEGNFCMRRNIFDECLPQRKQPDLFTEGAHISLLYKFNTRGYLGYFIPVVANFGRMHSDQRGSSREEGINKDVNLYNALVKKYRRDLLSGAVKHYFRNGSSEIIGEIKKEELGKLRRDIWMHYIKYKIRKRLIETSESI
jgi:glycosyltransferase involved in cell wall biosynthesis